VISPAVSRRWRATDDHVSWGGITGRSIVERTITGKPGDPIAVAYAGLYLASDEAAWVTGTDLVVDGGASTIM
jgi:NAD(P)-dependent dehydrogenase (short-subunit alcohol dehydrogenase family)